MRSTKDQLVKKDVLMPVKQCFPVEPSGCRRDSLVSHGRTAADSGQSGWPLWHAAKKAKHSLRAQAHLSKSRTETVKTETLEKNFEQREKKRTREEVTFFQSCVMLMSSFHISHENKRRGGTAVHPSQLINRETCEDPLGSHFENENDFESKKNQ
ncbi:hypothetical protein TNCV_3822011 [Trichonephila clavipes]|nr:hypothetical protein TNCV_3822011 [Trichonephila clavipes]